VKLNLYLERYKLPELIFPKEGRSWIQSLPSPELYLAESIEGERHLIYKK
jgi:hypothetical protein